MNLIKSFLDLSYILNSTRERIFFYLLVLIYFIYSLNIFPPDIVLAASLFLFAISPISVSFFFFIFYLLWEYVTVFSFGLTVVMVMQLVLLLKIILSQGLFPKDFSNSQKALVSIQKKLFFFLLIYAFFSLVFYQSFTGLSFAVKAIVAGYAIRYFSNEKGTNIFFKAFFQVLVISSLIATIYGYRNETMIDRWISGMGGTASQFSGTLGTTRMGIFYVLSSAYFLYYVKDLIPKLIGLMLFVIMTILTISITSALLLLVVFGIYYISRLRSVRSIILIISLGLMIFLAFPYWSRIPIVQPLLYRFEYSIDNIDSGDYDKATSSRTETNNIFIDYFENSSTFSKIFGSASTSSMSLIGSDINTHNSFSDIIIYSGVLGLLLFFIFEIRKIIIFKDSSSFFPYLTIKCVLFAAAITVSIMNSSYFNILSFL